MADKQPEGKLRKFRALKDFTDPQGQEHKQGDIVEMAFAEARALVNSDKLTADLGPAAED
jgi:hypothetical protein